MLALALAPDLLCMFDTLEPLCKVYSDTTRPSNHRRVAGLIALQSVVQRARGARVALRALGSRCMLGECKVRLVWKRRPEWRIAGPQLD